MSHKLITLFVLTVLLAGCGTMTTPQPQIVTQVVKVEVPVKCVRPVIKPLVTNFDQAKKGDPLYGNLALLAAENDHLTAYSTQLNAALNKCSK